ncbi:MULTISPECIES: hypothetical protein [unclassified Amycolatopsis]|uniref:hypothetical protein n=1 Tax=unclassified Amycolatopsis TaxID=2618356 RepID=UPI0028764D5E|nr:MULTISPECIES: hypothetical protein [unclassified Amycolatopsis]MDS0137868.1 hypothetical protein [Amycolatopsis sp. 505]MDS0144219.1 hypothetical protein [Amycolatopsis sp. CM201R]
MTLLVIAPGSDETAVRFAGFALRQGVPAVVSAGFGRVGVSVHATRDRACSTRLTLDGAEVSGVLNRGVGDWGEESDPDRSFAAAETYAAFWSAVALWPGPVVNRPSERGFFARLDPLEQAGTGLVEPPRTVVLNDGSAPGNDVYRIPEWTAMAPEAPRSRFDVVQIADRDPARSHRFVVAGAGVFDVGAAGGEPSGKTADLVAPIAGWLRRRGMGFADFTVEFEAEVVRLTDVSCWPSHHLFPHLEDRIYTALLSELTP